MCCTDVQGETIYRALYTKSLGFYVDQNLDWGMHIDHVIKKNNFQDLLLLKNCKLSPYGSIKNYRRIFHNVTSPRQRKIGVKCRL